MKSSIEALFDYIAICLEALSQLHDFLLKWQYIAFFMFQNMIKYHPETAHRN